MHIDLIRKPEKEFPEVPQKETVTSLRLVHCKYRSLSALAEFKNLEELSVVGFADTSFAMLSALEKLRSLRVIVKAAALSDLNALATITSLKALSLATPPSWDSTSKVLTIASLEPLTKLPRLQHLELFGVVPPDRSLAPLSRCKRLESLRVSKYPAAHVKEFRTSTGVNDDSFNPRMEFET